MLKELNIIEASKMPNTEFRIIYPSGEERNGHLKTNDNGNFIDHNKKPFKGACYYDIIQATFIPVQKSVSFIEAVEAYKNGKTIKCDYTEYTGQKTTNVYRCGGMDECFVDQLDCAVSPREILKGEWYIKD